MTNFFKYIKWVLTRKTLENDLRTFCRLEFREDEVEFAFTEAMRYQKASIFGVV